MTLDTEIITVLSPSSECCFIASWLYGVPCVYNQYHGRRRGKLTENYTYFFCSIGGLFGSFFVKLKVSYQNKPSFHPTVDFKVSKTRQFTDIFRFHDNFWLPFTPKLPIYYFNKTVNLIFFPLDATDSFSRLYHQLRRHKICLSLYEIIEIYAFQFRSRFAFIASPSFPLEAIFD